MTVANLPTTMSVIEAKTPGAPGRCSRLPPGRCRHPVRGEVLVKVAAAGVNRPDLMQRQGNYPPPPGASDMPGLEVAGRDRRHSAQRVARWRAGRSRVALVAGGGYAEYCVVARAAVPAVPRGLSMDEAAAHPGDVLHRLDQRLRARTARRPARSLLVHGGASGIGTTAIQLARRVRRARVRHGRLARKVRGLRAAWRRARDQLPRRGFRRRRPASRPAVAAWTSSSTWSAATTSRRNLEASRWTAASCRSRSCMVRSADSQPQPADAEAHHVHRIDAAAAHRGEKGAIARGARSAKSGRSSSAAKCGPVLHAVFPLARRGCSRTPSSRPGSTSGKLCFVCKRESFSACPS